MLLSILVVCTAKKTDPEDNDDILDSFLNKDIKIFLFAYSHIHLAENKSQEEGDFIATSKYYSSDKFKFNDKVNLKKNGDQYNLTIGDSKTCVKNKSKITKCDEKEEQALFDFQRDKNGYTIRSGNKCITKTGFFEVSLLKCTSGDDQIFDFKNIFDLNICEELLKRDNEEKLLEKKRHGNDKEYNSGLGNGNGTGNGFKNGNSNDTGNGNGTNYGNDTSYGNGTGDGFGNGTGNGNYNGNGNSNNFPNMDRNELDDIPLGVRSIHTLRNGERNTIETKKPIIYINLNDTKNPPHDTIELHNHEFTIRNKLPQSRPLQIRNVSRLYNNNSHQDFVNNLNEQDKNKNVSDLLKFHVEHFPNIVMEPITELKKPKPISHKINNYEYVPSKIEVVSYENINDSKM